MTPEHRIAEAPAGRFDGESIEGFATRVFDAWKLGQKGKDNGVLVIVAPSERKMRIEVGYGLEGTLTDAAASRIIREAIACLPATQRTVLSLRDIDGWSSDEVCHVLDISPTNQRVLLHRARAGVRAKLNPHLEAEIDG